jgi:hypothetical protein
MVKKTLKQIVQEAAALGYPFPDDLKRGVRFYADEAYFDKVDLGAATLEEQHPYANGCDCCENPAEFMTCPDDDTTLYICRDCVKKYSLERLVDGL